MIFNPLYILYRKGPYINGLGFWEGRSNEEICSILTNTKNEIWLKNSEECNEIINSNYESFTISIYTLIIILIFWKCISLFLYYICVIKPLKKAIVLYNKQLIR